MIIPFEWQMIDKKSRGFTERAKIHGGWLVRTFDDKEEETGTLAITFVPDPDHGWSIN